MNINRAGISVIIFVIVMIIPVLAFSSSPVLIGSMKGGSYIIESEIEGFELKLLPSIGGGIDIGYTIADRVEMGLDMAFIYAFRSNYRGYFYYGPFYSLPVSAYLGYRFIKTVKWALTAGIRGGISPLISEYESSRSFFVSFYTGVEIKSKKFPRFGGVYLCYSHGFFDGYKLSDTLMVETRFILFNRKSRRSIRS